MTDSRSSQQTRGSFVVATPYRSVCDDYARVLSRDDRLRLYATWNRRGTAGIPAQQTRLFPPLGLLAYAGARTLPPYRAESFRFSLYPLYDRWVQWKLKPGDHIISSYAYANACFATVRAGGGSTFLDGGNSHPANFWEILEEEHRRWKCPTPPVARFYIERARRMMDEVSYVLSPSSFVSRSFLERGFRREQILPVVYSIDLANFRPAETPRPKDRPLTLINTSGLSLRKGTPYLLEAFRLIRRQIPDARLILTELVTDSMKPLLHQYADLPIEWVPPLPHDRLALLLQSADVFVLPSLEDGFARTVSEAVTCGLPAVLTPNTGASDLIDDQVTGSIVPIRDSAAIADAAIAWWERLQAGEQLAVGNFQQKVSPARMEELFSQALRSAGVLDS